MLTSVYVHFPWCARKCPYCDFATRRIEPSEVPHERYAEALLRELDSRRSSLDGRRLFSVFFGGGTPSLWNGSALARVLTHIREAFGSEVEQLEVTAEANPNSLTPERIDAFRAAGVNRLSIGVQSLRDEHLQFLGRLHDRDEALRVIADATQRMGRVSADLMFGMPGQSVERLVQDATELIATGVEHVSAYALTIEPGTQFGELSRLGRLEVCPEETYAEMFHAIENTFEQLGFEHYEVSNYARPSKRSRHNTHYWRGGAYLGLGAAAVGCLHDGVGSARRYKNEPDGMRYMDGGAEVEEERLDADTIVREGLMLGLRTAEGVGLAELETRAGRPWNMGREREVTRRLDSGDLLLEHERLRVPQERWLMLDGIVADLF